MSIFSPGTNANEAKPLNKREVFYRSTDGLRLYAADYGPEDSPLAVFCMHGLTRNHKDFEPMIEGLNLPLRFISVDVRGRGKSDRDLSGNTYTPAHYVQDMMALVDHLALKKIVLIGTSMGGLMAMLMAHLHPDAIKGIILNDIGPEVGAEGIKRIAGYAGGSEVFHSWVEAAQTIGNTQEAIYPEFSESEWLEFAKRTCIQTNSGEIIFDYDPAIVKGMDIKPPNWRMRLMAWRLFGATKKFPLLIIRGETSDILSGKIANRMKRRHKTSELLAVPQRGHAPTLSEPDALQAIRTFLSHISATV